MDIYITRNGEEFGPYTRESAFAHMKEDTISPDDLAWHEGMTDWLPLKDVLAGVKPQFAHVAEAEVPEPQPEKSAPVRAAQAFVAFVRKAVALARRMAGIGSKIADGTTRAVRIIERLMVRLALVVAIVGGGVWAYNHPESVRRWIADGRGLVGGLLSREAPQEPKPEVEKAAPVENPAPVIAAAQPEVVEATPPPPEETPAPVRAEPQIDFATLAASPALLPRTLVLKASAVFPAIANDGRQMGSVTAPRGATVNLLALNGETVRVEFHKGTTVIPARDTDLLERARANAVQRAAQ
jgi:hypothetical protein